MKSRDGRKSISLCALLVLPLIAVYSGCGFGKSGGGPIAGNPGMAVFQLQVHPILKQYCYNCHGLTQAPTFAVNSIEDSYSAAKGVMHRIPEKAGDNHNACVSGGWCQQAEEALSPAILAWAAAESSGSLHGVVLASQTVPANLAATFQTMTWNVPTIADTSLSLELRVHPVGNTYEIRNPRLVVGNSVHIKDVQFHVNGVVHASINTYTTVDMTVDPPNAVLSSSVHLVPLINGPGVDTIVPAIGEIVQGLSPCVTLNDWVSEIKPILQGDCMDCHDGTDVNAVAAFPMLPSMSDGEICSEFKSRSNLAIPSSGLTLLKPISPTTGGVPLNHGGGVRFSGSSSEYSSFVEWIMGEP